ncbi:MAG TPA: hypothetical protein DEW10_07195, partial [Bifidobacterium sp.]|nr:hypothetical protein [Bifidobacterium sp.]
MADFESKTDGRRIRATRASTRPWFAAVRLVMPPSFRSRPDNQVDESERCGQMPSSRFVLRARITTMVA